MNQVSTDEVCIKEEQHDNTNNNRNQNIKTRIQSPSPPPQASVAESLECRICRDTTAPLLIVCRCTTRVHPNCLRRWVGYRADAMFPLLASDAHTICEICRHPILRSVLQPSLSSSPRTETPVEMYQNPSNDSLSTHNWITRKFVAHADRFCEYIISVEGCLLLFLFVLAVMGHLLFVLGIYSGTKADQYAIERMALGIANALLTLSLLILVQKIVSRWLRENDLLIAVASAPLHVNDVEAQTYSAMNSSGNAYTPHIVSEQRRSTTTRCSFIGQVILGIFLSVVAAAELFFLMRQLPFGTLA